MNLLANVVQSNVIKPSGTYLNTIVCEDLNSLCYCFCLLNLYYFTIFTYKYTMKSNILEQMSNLANFYSFLAG
jgi:hypothetical protein